MAASCDEEGTTWLFSNCGGILELQQKFSLPLLLAQGSPIFHSSCERELGIALESLQGKRDLIQACVQGLMFLSRGDRNLWFAYQTHPGSQASPRGAAKDSILLSNREGYVLESTE